jgi:hypothetical protein
MLLSFSSNPFGRARSFQMQRYRESMRVSCVYPAYFGKDWTFMVCSLWYSYTFQCPKYNGIWMNMYRSRPFNFSVLWFSEMFSWKIRCSSHTSVSEEHHARPSLSVALFSQGSRQTQGFPMARSGPRLLRSEGSSPSQVFTTQVLPRRGSFPQAIAPFFLLFFGALPKGSFLTA